TPVGRARRPPFRRPPNPPGSWSIVPSAHSAEPVPSVSMRASVHAPPGIGGPRRDPPRENQNPPLHILPEVPHDTRHVSAVVALVLSAEISMCPPFALRLSRGVDGPVVRRVIAETTAPRWRDRSSFRCGACPRCGAGLVSGDHSETLQSG